jgi:hypothetical protein
MFLMAVFGFYLLEFGVSFTFLVLDWRVGIGVVLD